MIHRFEDFELDHARLQLRRAGVVVPIEPRVFDLIAYLVRHSDRLVSKAELFASVWAGRVVVDGALSVAVAAARRALDDDSIRQRAIRTAPGRGYQFVMTCTAEGSGDPPSAWKPSAGFVGRDPELGRFEEACLSLLADSRFSTLIVSGEPGIGKSRLLAEFADLTRSRGIAVYLGRCPESKRTPSLWPWSQILRRLSADRPGLISSLPQPHLASLAPLLPEAFPESNAIAADNPEVERFRLFEAIASAIRLLCGSSPTVVAIEDLHRSDDATLRFLQFAVQELQDAPLAIILTLRPSEIHLSDAHANATAFLASQPHTTHLELKGLNAEATYELVRALAGDISPTQAADIFRRTAGNPFFIQQLATLPEADWRGDMASITQMPATVSKAILHHTSSLTQRTQDLLTTAAIIGREFSSSLLAQVTGDTREAVLEALDEGIRASIIRRSAEDPDHFSFVHVLVRDALDSQLTLHQRRHLHLRVGLELDAKPSTSSDRAMGEAAHHLGESGVDQVMPRVLELSQSAGTLATRRSAHEDAAHHYARAIDALRTADPGDQSRLCRLLILRGESLCRAGDRTKAEETLATAASIARSLGATSDLARAALGVAPGFLAIEGGVADPSLQELLLEALACLDDSDNAMKVLVSARLAMSLHWTERESRMSEMLQLAQTLGARECKPAVLLHVRFAEWFCEWNHKSFDRRSKLAEAIQTLAEDVRDSEMTLVGMVLRMTSMLERGELSQFDNTLISFNRLAQQLRSPQSLWYYSMYRGVRALIDGQLDHARQHQSEFSEIASKVGDANAFHSLVAQTALLRWEEDALDSMIPALEAAATRYPGIRAFRSGLAWSYSQLGRFDDATRELSVISRHDFLDVPQRYDWSAAIAFAAEACAAVRDPRGSKMLFDLLEPCSGRFLLVGLGVACLGAADRLLGLLAAAFGRPDQAQWHLEQAVSLTSAAGMKVWNARSKLDLAELLRRHQGARGRSSIERLASECLAVAQASGLRSLRERAEAILGARSPRK